MTHRVAASARQCKCSRFSLPLYRKLERSLFTAALEQTSNVLTSRNVGRSRRRASGLPTRRPDDDRDSPLPSPLRHLPSLRFDTCATVPKIRPLPAVKRAHPPGACDDNQLSSGIRRGGCDSSANRPLRYSGRAPPVPSPRTCHHRPCDRPQVAMGSGIQLRLRRRYVLGRNRES